MKRLLVLFTAFATLTACSSTPTARYALEMNTTDTQDTAQLAQQTLNVMQRRLENMGEEKIRTTIEKSGSGTATVSVSSKNQEPLNALTDAMMQPFDFAILAQAQKGEKADVTVEKYGAFVRTGITGADLSWVEADQEPGKDLGRVHLVFTLEGRNKIAELFKKMKGKNIGIFVRGQLVSLLLVETDELKDDIVIQDIPSVDLAHVFADDVNVGIHVTITPLP